MAKSWKKFLPQESAPLEQDQPSVQEGARIELPLDDTLRGLLAERAELEQKMKGITEGQQDSSVLSSPYTQEIPSIPSKRKADQAWEAKRKAVLGKHRLKTQNPDHKSTPDSVHPRVGKNLLLAGKEKAKNELNKQLAARLAHPSRKKDKRNWQSQWEAKRVYLLEKKRKASQEFEKWEARKERALDKLNDAKQAVQSIRDLPNQIKEQQEQAGMKSSSPSQLSFLSDQKWKESPIIKKWDSIHSKVKEKLSAKKKYNKIIEPLLQADEKPNLQERLEKLRQTALAQKLEAKAKEAVASKIKDLKAEKPKKKDKPAPFEREKSKKEPKDGLSKRKRRMLDALDNPDASPDELMGKRRKRKNTDENSPRKAQRGKDSIKKREKPDRPSRSKDLEDNRIDVNKSTKRGKDDIKEREDLFNRKRAERKESQKLDDQKEKRSQQRKEEIRQSRSEERRRQRRAEENRFNRI